MSFKKYYCLIAVFFSFQLYAALPAEVNGQPLPSLAPILEQTMPSVVNIYTQTRVRVRSPLLDDPFFRHFFNVPDVPRERISQSLGSGVIVDAQAGYILTNNHVIEGADDISVTLNDGRSIKAERVGVDPDTDLAVIQIEAENLSALQLADSDQLRVGDFVVAVGNPFGLGQTVTSGIVSALGRTGLRGLEFQDLIQTDAPINPGNSGGALLNLRGELVGINSAIYTPSGGNVGIGFAIPARMARYVLRQLVAHGEVNRGTLGIEVQDLSTELADAFGVDVQQGAIVTEVIPDSAADKAGLGPGDLVTAVSGRRIRNAQDFLNAEGLMPIGETLELEYIRRNKVGTAKATLQEPRRLRGAKLDRRLSGGWFEELPSKLRKRGLNGVLLSEIEAGSRLYRNRLRAGDILTSVNRQPVTNLTTFERVVDAAGNRLLVRILRNGDAYWAVLE